MSELNSHCAFDKVRHAWSGAKWLLLQACLTSVVNMTHIVQIIHRVSENINYFSNIRIMYGNVGCIQGSGYMIKQLNDVIIHIKIDIIRPMCPFGFSHGIYNCTCSQRIDKKQKAQSKMSVCLAKHKSQ